MSFGLQGIVFGTVPQQCNKGEVQFDQFLLKSLSYGSRRFDAGAVVQSFQSAISVTFCCVYQLQRLEAASIVQFYKTHIFLPAMVADPSPDRDFVSDVRVLREKEVFDFHTFFAHCVSFLSKIVLQGGILSIKKSVPVSKDGW